MISQAFTPERVESNFDMHFDLHPFSHRLQNRNSMSLRGNISRYLRIWVVPLTKPAHNMRDQLKVWVSEAHHGCEPIVSKRLLMGSGGLVLHCTDGLRL